MNKIRNHRLYIRRHIGAWLYGAATEDCFPAFSIRARRLFYHPPGVLALLVLVSLLARKLDQSGWLEAWLTKPPPLSKRPPSLGSRDVPGPVLGLTALLGLVVFTGSP